MQGFRQPSWDDPLEPEFTPRQKLHWAANQRLSNKRKANNDALDDLGDGRVSKKTKGMETKKKGKQGQGKALFEMNVGTAREELNNCEAAKPLIKDIIYLNNLKTFAFIRSQESLDTTMSACNTVVDQEKKKMGDNAERVMTKCKGFVFLFLPI